MDLEQIEAAANGHLFERLGVPATITVPGSLPKQATVVIERNAEVTDARGIVLETRCEIGLNVAEVGEGDRGVVIETGRDCWILLEPIGSDGLESRWVAGRG